MVALVVVPGPWETVIPPTLMDNSGFRAKLQQSLSFGDQPIFNRLAETAERIDSEMLVLEQDGARFAVDERGAMRIDQKLVDGKEHFLPVIVEEHIISAIEAALRFAGWLLDEVDEVRRVSDVAIAAGLVNCRSYAWRTLAEDQASGGSVTMSNLGESHFIEPSRHVSKRSGLLHDTDALVEDIVARLRRAVKNGG